jgi:histone H3/H4
MADSSVWRQCSACRAAIGFLAKYYDCSVTTCQRGRAKVVFCSVNCWQAHSVSVRHRDAWAEENTAPSQRAWQQAQAGGSSSEQASKPSAMGVRRVVSSSGSTSTSSANPAEKPSLSLAGVPKETLVVASKLKEYVRARSGMNTSDGVMKVLSEHLRALATRAIRNAGEDGRKTVLDRDFLKALSDRSRPNE